MTIENDFIELAKRHNKRFGSSYPTTKEDIKLFFYRDGLEHAVSAVLVLRTMDEMKARLMAAPVQESRRDSDVGFYKFLTGTIVVGVTIAAIVRAFQ